MVNSSPKVAHSSRPATTSRRFSEVFVELPYSPYRRTMLDRDQQANGSSMRAHLDTDTSASNAGTSYVKRKRSRQDLSDTEGSKKYKPSGDNNPKIARATPNKVLSEKQSNASEEYPNGFFYCHQCNHKRDATRLYLNPHVFTKCSRMF
jgi:hypothetical protein